MQNSTIDVTSVFGVLFQQASKIIDDDEIKESHDPTNTPSHDHLPFSHYEELSFQHSPKRSPLVFTMSKHDSATTKLTTM